MGVVLPKRATKSPQGSRGHMQVTDALVTDARSPPEPLLALPKTERRHALTLLSVTYGVPLVTPRRRAGDERPGSAGEQVRRLGQRHTALSQGPAPPPDQRSEAYWTVWCCQSKGPTGLSHKARDPPSMAGSQKAGVCVAFSL